MTENVSLMVDDSLRGMRVDVYKNLNRDCYSVKMMDPGHEDYGIVLDHVEEIQLEDVEFVVQESGRQRVIEEGRKNVHAFVRGTVREGSELSVYGDRTPFTYNPYEMEKFQTVDGEPLDEAKAVDMRQTERLAIL